VEEYQIYHFFAMDVTSQKKLEMELTEKNTHLQSVVAQLEEAVKVKSRFLANMSHGRKSKIM
jgi:hypothetical protein